ncbi:type I-C CRISPR-associated protein Cas5c [Puniceicoccaceae bacterium K14]|nr:type I-C CRISPR-associated protein Cas5c [Puniceicoccaceae bacterium K14]
MSHGIKLEISGDYALFSRPEMKVERVSYDVITPSAARGVLEAIYWKPQIRWVIDKIHVINPIRFTNIRRNEISSKIPTKGKSGVSAAMANGSGNLGIDVTEHRQQRASLLLRDVRYVIEAHFEILERRFERDGPELSEKSVAGKHLDMFKRRARKGQCFQQPYFGCREFPVRFELIEKGTALPEPHESLIGERDLGFMLHDIDFVQDPKTKKVKSTTPRFYRPLMENGLIDVRQSLEGTSIVS